MLDLALEDTSLAGAAGTVAAAVRQQQAGGERGLEHGLVVVGLEGVVAGLEGNPVAHGA